MMLIHGRHGCSTVCQIKAERGHKLAERPLHITQVVCRDNGAIEEAKKTKSLRLISTTTAIACMDHSILYVMKEVLSYTGTFGLQYGVSFADPFSIISSRTYCCCNIYPSSAIHCTFGVW